MIKGSDVFGLLQFFGAVGGIVCGVFFHIWLIAMVVEGDVHHPHRRQFARSFLLLELAILILLLAYGLIFRVDWSR